MLKTIKGDDGKPYISLEDLINEVTMTKQELENKLLDENSQDGFSLENIEDRLDFLEKLHESLKSIESEYYKRILGWNN